MSTTTARITKTPNVQGGEACIAGHRIPVWGLVQYRQMGLTEARILEHYPTITLDDLHAAWEYAASHSEEIAEAIRKNEAVDEGDGLAE